MKFFYLLMELQILRNTALFILSDRECKALEFGKKNKIYSKQIFYSQNDNIQLINELEKISPDIIITNWHKIIDKEVLGKFRNKFINLHYSLLPAFKGYIGNKPIELAYEKNCQFIGVTCHELNENVDDGRIISQALIMKKDITFENIVALVFKIGCLNLLNSAILLNPSFSENITIYDPTQMETSVPLTQQGHLACFSPALKFNINSFDEMFWNHISKI